MLAISGSSGHFRSYQQKAQKQTNDFPRCNLSTPSSYKMNSLNPPRTPSRAERKSSCSGSLKRKLTVTPQKNSALAPVALASGCESPCHKRSASALRTPLAKAQLNVRDSRTTMLCACV